MFSHFLLFRELFVFAFTFSALTLLVGQLEEHLASDNLTDEMLA